MTLLLVFLCGSLAGVLTMRYGLDARPMRPAAYWAEAGKEISLHRLEKELNLTPQQAKEMELVLDDFMMYYHTLLAQMDDVRANGKARMLQVLNQEQKEKFEGLLSELHAKPVE